MMEIKMAVILSVVVLLVFVFYYANYYVGEMSHVKTADKKETAAKSKIENSVVCETDWIILDAFLVTAICNESIVKQAAMESINDLLKNEIRVNVTYLEIMLTLVERYDKNKSYWSSTTNEWVDYNCVWDADFRYCYNTTEIEDVME